ncbi:MAG: hypothetical protein WKF92_09310 [Pyrinomonadaceae bacterium]
MQVARSLADADLPTDVEARIIKTIEARWQDIQIPPSKRSERKRPLLTP